MDDSSTNRDGENNISGDQGFPEKSMDAISKEQTKDPSVTPTEAMHTDAPTEVATSLEQQEGQEENTNIGAEAAQSSQQEIPDIESPSDEEPLPQPEPVDIKIIYNKKKYDHSIDINSTILDLKKDIEKLTGVPVATQKVMFKGSTQDGQTLKELKVTKSANKFMVIGSTMNDLLKMAAPDLKTLDSDKGDKSAASSKEPLCKQTAHKKVLDKHGKPEDCAVGIKGSALPLPPTPLSGMYNKYGGKTRLTFKLDSDELWIGTKERTQKVKMGSIKDVVSQPIEGHEEYHIMGIQLGTTEASKYWIYWVPAQYINAIKDTVLGKWGEF